MDTKIKREGIATLIYLPSWEWIPNSALPVIVYPQAFATDKPNLKDRVAKRLQTSGWGNTWVAGIYPYPHYHSNTHEVLVVLSGRCEIQLGGPEGYQLAARAGDAVVLPAGTGHACYSTTDYRVFGAYPGGKSWDLITGAPEHRDPEQLPLPEQDPLGERGVLRSAWARVAVTADY